MTTPGVHDRWVGDDDALLGELRGALRDSSDSEAADDDADQGLDEATTARMYSAARAAFTWRTIDDELELLAAVEQSESDLALVRGSEEPISRTLEFAGRTIGIELEIGPDLIVGQIYPVQVGQLTLFTDDGATAEFTSDEVGCFTVDRPAGSFRLRCTTSDAGVITDWICMT